MTDPIDPNDHTADPDELLPTPEEVEWVDEHQDGDDRGHVYHDDETDVVLPPEPPPPAGFADFGDALTVKPIYRMPFWCPGEKYRGTTYPGHSRCSVDYNAIDGHDIGDHVLGSIDARVYAYIASNGQVMTENDDGFGIWYVHLINVKVKVGDRIRVGDHFADLGNTGIGSTGPHLHINHTFRRVQMPIIWEGTFVEVASVPVNDKYRSGPLFDCHTGHALPHPEDPMKRIVVSQAQELVLPVGTQLYSDLGTTRFRTVSVPDPRTFGSIDGVKGFRAVEVLTGGELTWLYAKDDVGALVPKVTPPAPDCSAAEAKGYNEAIVEEQAWALTRVAR